MTEPQISWSELVALMAVGTGADPSLRGVVRVREPEEVEDEYVDATSTTVDIPHHGRYVLRDESCRVFMRGELARRERPDGSPLGIVGDSTVWVWEDDGELPVAYPRHLAMWGWPDNVLTSRRELDSWSRNDFTHPTGQPAPTTFLGRSAWSVELRPPPHKPFPLSLVVDAETGLVLSQRNEGFGSFVEWEELQVGLELPDDLFIWDGPTLPPRDRDAEREAERQAELSEQAEWMSRYGMNTPSVLLPVEMYLHETSEDGTFFASLRTDLHASLARRPESTAPWDPRMSYPHLTRWTAGGYDWCLGTSRPLSDEVIAQLRASWHS